MGAGRRGLAQACSRARGESRTAPKPAAELLLARGPLALRQAVAPAAAAASPFSVRLWAGLPVPPSCRQPSGLWRGSLPGHRERRARVRRGIGVGGGCVPTPLVTPRDPIRRVCSVPQVPACAPRGIRLGVPVEARRRIAEEQSGRFRPAGTRAGGSRAAETCRNPLFGLFGCRYPRTIAESVADSRPRSVG